MRAAEAVGSRSDAGQNDAAGCAGKKFLKPPRRRQVVQYLRGGYGVSERRACVVIRLQRGTYQYQSHKDPRTELRMRMREIATMRVRYGYRKILVLLQREGLALRWTVPRKRRVAVERRERPKASGPNPVWSLDFVTINWRTEEGFEP